LGNCSTQQPKHEIRAGGYDSIMFYCGIFRCCSNFQVNMLIEKAYTAAKKLHYAKANGATKEQAEKFADHVIDKITWDSFSPIVYDKSPKHINGWDEAIK